MSLIWLFPVLWAVLNSFRNYSYTSTHGYVSFGGFTFQNYANAWKAGDFQRHFLNSVIITVPARRGSRCFFACCVGVRGSRGFRSGSNLPLLVIFTAANLLPQQALLEPLYKLYNSIQVPFWFSDSGSLYDSYWAVIITHIAFQTGFCHLRDEQLHEDAPQGADRGIAGRRRRSAATVLPDHPAAVPAGAGRTGYARDHLDLQRLLLGGGVHEHGATSTRSRPRCRT